ncbi:MAG: hypothetical protein IT426_14635 [Pirellulales bacterium]|nr:hypothetical protein [Pirellulales bacterium]
MDPIKAELAAAVKRLDERLTAAGPTGEPWRKYLHWNALQEELAREGAPQRETLLEVYRQFTAGEEGLNLVWFVEVQRALRQYLRVAGTIGNADASKIYAQNLDRLAAALKAYSVKPTADDALIISESLRGLKADRQAPGLEQAVVQLFRLPNLYVDIDEDVVNAALAEEVDETAPLEDCILGTSIQGTTHTVGRASAKLAESNRFSIIDTYLMATAYSDTVGRNGPVCIYSNGTTCIGAIKRLWIDENGLFSHPASSHAVTNTCINDIQSIKGRKFVERIAWKKAGKQLPKAECIASRRAEARVNERIDERADKALAEANEKFQQKIRRPLVERKLFPEDVKFTSGERSMHVRSMQAGTSLIAAPSLPPEAEKADMTVRIHESMVNNYALDALGGMTIRQEQAEKAIIDTFGELPEKMKNAANEEPWGITFAKRQPISVTFADDGFKVTIHGEKFYRGAEPHDAMDVTAIYKIEKTAEGFKAVRQGDLQIFPPGFDVAGEQQLSAKITATRNLLKNRFGKVFEPEIVLKSFALKDKLEKVGKFEPTQFVCRDGWLVLAWKRVPAEKK